MPDDDSHVPPLRDRYPGYWDIGLAIWGAVPLFVLGIFLPFMTLYKFKLFANTVSIYSALKVLWADGEMMLYLLILFFSVLIPMTKLIMQAVVWFYGGIEESLEKRLLKVIHYLGKLSVTEILVAAITVVAIKFGVFAEVEVHMGVYVLFASVALSSWASVRMECITREMEDATPTSKEAERRGSGPPSESPRSLRDDDYQTGKQRHEASPNEPL